MSNRPYLNRSTSYGRKVLPPHARTSKPPAIRRGPSYIHHPTQRSDVERRDFQDTASAAKQAGGKGDLHQHIEDEEGGMASFLQFCATCEKQIVTPGVSILYCSEACRRRDVSQPTSTQMEAVKSPLGLSSPPSYLEHPPADIVPQRSPTVLRPISLTLSELSLSDLNSPSDDDTSFDDESSHYLDAFYPGLNMAPRPRTNRASTATDASALPSLVNSPSSSYGTVASTTSCYRPLAPRHTSMCSAQSIDLVMPYPTATENPSLKSSASTLTSFRVAEGNDISYDRRASSRRSLSGASSGNNIKADRSLKQLFSHEAIRAEPRSR